jgi:hypothetical protein
VEKQSRATGILCYGAQIWMVPIKWNHFLSGCHSGLVASMATKFLPIHKNQTEKQGWHQAVWKWGPITERLSYSLTTALHILQWSSEIMN